MTSQHTVLLYGGTGRTGGRVLRRLLDRGVTVRALVRDPSRLPDDLVTHPMLSIVRADLLGLTPAELSQQLEGCDTVVSCLGHTVSLRGVLGPPHNLVTLAVRRTCHAIHDLRPPSPVRLVLMSSVSVNQPGRGDSRRSRSERAFLAAVRTLTPPAKDNQRAADYLAAEVGTDSRDVAWVVVRPDTLEPGDSSDYRATEQPTASVFRPDHTRMANVAEFMCELVTDPQTWGRWRSRMPVVVDG